ncbi:MAG: hypothetical protein R3C45_00925 [Phycisphaerales bacterium]
MLRPFSILIVSVVISLWPPLSHADEAPHARAYLDTLQTRLQQVDAQMSAISEAADLAAKALVEGKSFAVCGDDGLANELSNRAGAMMGYDGRRGEAGDVVLYVFGLVHADTSDVRALLIRQIDEAARLKAGGSVVIGLGSRSQLRSYALLDEAQGACAALIDNHVPAVDGLFFDAEGKAIVPMGAVMNAAAAWTFECELFAALPASTRCRWYARASRPTR